MAETVIINVSLLYKDTGTAKLSELPAYEARALELAGNGNNVTLTGQGPVWLYLRLSHVLHGKARKLVYDSPVTGEVVVYDHSPD
jgi:CRISPR-associated Csx3 family protein